MISIYIYMCVCVHIYIYISMVDASRNNPNWGAHGRLKPSEMKHGSRNFPQKMQFKWENQGDFPGNHVWLPGGDPTMWQFPSPIWGSKNHYHKRLAKKVYSHDIAVNVGNPLTIEAMVSRMPSGSWRIKIIRMIRANGNAIMIQL